MTSTWTKGTLLWPRDLLPKSIPNCRVLLYGYESTVFRADGPNLPKTELEKDAVDILVRLALNRKAAGRVRARVMSLTANST